MSRIIEIKFTNTKSTQKQTAKELGYSDSTLKRSRNDIKLNNPQNTLKKTPIELKRPVMESAKPIKNEKSKFKGVSSKENFEKKWY